MADDGVLAALAEMRELVAQLERENAALRHVIDNPSVALGLEGQVIPPEQFQLLSLLNYWQGRARSAEQALHDYADWAHDHGYLELSRAVKARAEP